MLFAGIFKRVVFAIFFTNLLLLLAGMSCPWINPNLFWIPSFLGLFFKVLFGIHLFFMLIFVIGRLKKLIILSTTVLIICLPAFSKNFALHLSLNKAPELETISLLTYNIDNFGILKGESEISNILKTIETEKPDIMCFQEYLINQAIAGSVYKKLDQLGYHYKYEYFTDNIGNGNKVGQALFSKYQIHNATSIPFGKTSNGAFYADIIIKADTLRLFNIHFQSITLRSHEIKIPTSLNDFKPPQTDYYRMLFVKIRSAFETRARQVGLVRQKLKSHKYPVILCGDFNDSPTSYAYQQMTESLHDVFLKTGFGIGSTFGGMIPLQRIDYVLVDPAIKAESVQVLNKKGSDHFPLIVKFSLH